MGTYVRAVHVTRTPSPACDAQLTTIDHSAPEKALCGHAGGVANTSSMPSLRARGHTYMNQLAYPHSEDYA